MSIREVQGPLSAVVKKTAEQDRMFGNLPSLAKKVAQADEITLRKQLQELWDMPIPPGVAGNEVYHQRQRDIRKVERQLRKLGVISFSGGADNDD